MLISLTYALFAVFLLQKSRAFSSNRTRCFNNPTALASNVRVIRQTYLDMFSKPRSTIAEKDPVRQQILSLFKELGLETREQKFDYSRRPGVNMVGVNLIGIRAGKNRGIPGKTDNIIVIASHWDTVARAPGIDDNGSGSVVVVEVARLLHESKVQLDHTVIFVSLDLEENGLLGSQAFVNKWLIPKELIAKKANFLGAYVMDMDLFYDPRPGSQGLPYDISSVSNFLSC